jgi:hypothetical protein
LPEGTVGSAPLISGLNGGGRQGNSAECTAQIAPNAWQNRRCSELCPQVTGHFVISRSPVQVWVPAPNENTPYVRQQSEPPCVFPQLRVRNTPRPQGERKWISRVTSSFPTPLSPRDQDGGSQRRGGADSFAHALRSRADAQKRTRWCDWAGRSPTIQPHGPLSIVAVHMDHLPSGAHVPTDEMSAEVVPPCEATAFS